MILTRDEIRRIGGQFGVKKIERPEYTYYVREITAKQFDTMQQMGAAFLNGGALSRAKAVAYFLCDEEGNRLFADHQISEIENMRGALIDDIFLTGWTYNQLGEDVEAKAVEELEKN